MEDILTEQAREEKKIENFITILKHVDLLYLNKHNVKNMFNKAYTYLLSKDETDAYLECARLKKIEEDYSLKLNTKKNLNMVF